MTATTPAEWVEALSMALMLCGSAAVPYFLFVDAAPADFDPRRLAYSDAHCRYLVEAVRLRHTLAAQALAVSQRLSAPTGGTR
jgi:hypothetical protein